MLNFLSCAKSWEKIYEAEISETDEENPQLHISWTTSKILAIASKSREVYSLPISYFVFALIIYSPFLNTSSICRLRFLNSINLVFENSAEEVPIFSSSALAKNTFAAVYFIFKDKPEIMLTLRNLNY